MGVTNFTIVKEIGSVVRSTILSGLALIVIGLGVEISISLMQTNDYSFGSIALLVSYSVLVIFVPVLIALFHMRRVRGSTMHMVVNFSRISLLVQLLFLPFVPLVFKM
jgi:hypothetical protein